MTPRMKVVVVCGLVVLPVLGIGVMGFVAPKVIVGMRGNTLTIREPVTLANETYLVDQHTRILRNGRPVNLQHLRIGDHVTVEVADGDQSHPVAVRVVASSVDKEPAHAVKPLNLRTFDNNSFHYAVETESRNRRPGDNGDR